VTIITYLTWKWNKVSFQANSNQKKNNYINERNNSVGYGSTTKIYRTVVSKTLEIVFAARS